MKTLYRAEAAYCQWPRMPAWARVAVSEGAGRWFADTLDEIEWYVKDATTEQAPAMILSVVVPDDVAADAWLPNQPREVQSHSRRLEREWFLPRVWADRAQPI